jgi:hypothetical protein
LQGVRGRGASGKIDVVGSDEIRFEAERLQRCCEFAAERQVTAASFWTNMRLFLGAAAAALAAFSSGFAFSEQHVLAGILAAAAALAAAVLASLGPAERSQAHQRAAGSYYALSVDIRVFRDFDARPYNGRQEIEIRKLLARSAALDANTPWVPRRLGRKTEKFMRKGQRYYDHAYGELPSAPQSRPERRFVRPKTVASRPERATSQP